MKVQPAMLLISLSALLSMPAAAFDAEAVHSRTVIPAARPAAEPVMCSFEEHVCVHVVRGVRVDGTAASRALHAAERALRLYRALGLPPPLSDGDRGGTSAVDIYLSSGDGAYAVAEADTDLAFDRAAAFADVGALSSRSQSCAFESDVARALAQAVLLGIDAGVHDGILNAQSSWLAHGAIPCGERAADAIDRAQQRPDLAIASTDVGRFSGALMFPWFLDDAYGTGSYGAVMNGLIAVSGQPSPATSRFYVNEPDVFDTLREVALERQLSWGELLVDYGIHRAFMGDRSDGVHLADSEWLGRAGRVRFEWAISYADLPKRVAPAYALEPTGIGYVWLDLADVDADAEVTIVAHWDDTHVFQWAAVRLDAKGREVGRHLFGGTFGHSSAQLSLRDLTSAASILVVGAHVGNDDRSKPYDPDRGLARKSGYTVTFHGSAP